MCESENQSYNNGHWEPAKQLPYYPCLREKFMCALGIHEWVESARYVDTRVCFRCGKRKVKR